MMRRAVIPVMILLVLSCAGNDQRQSSGSSVTLVESSSGGYSSMAGQDPVGAIPNAVLHDPQRNKDVEMVIEYPTRGGPHPIIIFSHGYGGSKNGYVALTEYWTSNGYVCIKPSHADAGALAAAAREAVPPPPPSGGQRQGRAEQRRERVQAAVAAVVVEAENVWKTQTEADWRNRVRDVTLIIDSLDALEEKYPELRGKMDHTRIGLGGHSYGAFTAMEIAGMKTMQNGSPLKLADGRVKAGVVMSPQGIGTVPGITADSWLDVKIPMLYMTGTLDRTADSEGVERRHDAFINSPTGDKYFISIEGARHTSFSGNFGITPDEMQRQPNATLPPGTYPRDPRDPNYDPNQPMQQAPRTRGAGTDYLRERNIFNVVKVSTLAFWGAYLKSETKGSDFLKSAGMRQRVGTTGSVETK